MLLDIVMAKNGRTGRTENYKIIVPKIAVVIMSNFSYLELTRKAFQLGVYDYLAVDLKYIEKLLILSCVETVS